MWLGETYKNDMPLSWVKIPDSLSIHSFCTVLNTRVTYSPVKLIYRAGIRYGPQSVGGKQAEGGKRTGSKGPPRGWPWLVLELLFLSTCVLLCRGSC